MNNASKIIMVGPDSLGGITSVIKMYLQNGLNEAEFMPSYIYANRFRQFIYYAKFLFKYTKRLFNINIIHIHTASRGSFLRKSIVFKIAKLFNKKVIIHIHGAEFDLFYQNSSNYIKQVIKDILYKSDLVIVLSEQWKYIIKKIAPESNIKVLYNPTTIKELYHHESEDINVLFLGRLGKRKGVYDIIEASKLLQNAKIKILLYGDGEKESFEKLIDDNNLNNKISLGGWICGTKKEKAFQESDIYILPSYNEGLPISILEAMSAGLPIISTNVGGIPEAVENNLNGFLIEAGDYKSLAEKIDLLANNRGLREQMGKESYRIVKEKFDIKIVLKQLLEIYNEIL